MAVRVFCLFVVAMLSLGSLSARSASAARAQSPDIDVLMQHGDDEETEHSDGHNAPTLCYGFGTSIVSWVRTANRRKRE